MLGPLDIFSQSAFAEVHGGDRSPDKEFSHSQRTSVAGGNALFRVQKDLCYRKDGEGIRFGSLGRSIEVVRHRQAALANDRCKLRDGGLLFATAALLWYIWTRVLQISFSDPVNGLRSTGKLESACSRHDRVQHDPIFAASPTLEINAPGCPA